MRLLAVEVRRLTSRRLVRVLVALALVGLLVAAAKTALESNRDFGAARAKAAARAADAARSFKAATADCEAAKRTGRAPAGTDCGQGEMGQDGKGFPSLDPQGFYVDPRFDFRREMPGRVDGAAILLAVIGFVVGASAIGAEWSAGTLASLLFWAPRRLRVLGAKAVALVCVLAVAVVVVEVLVLAAGYGTAAVRGTLDHATTGLMVSLALRVLRGVGLVAFTSLAAFAIAGLVRNTGAALGAGFVYFAIFENFVRGVRPGWSRWLVSSNFAGFLEHGIRLDVRQQAATALVPGVDPRFLLTFGRSALTLLLYVGLLVAVFALSFQRRDVT